MLYCNNQRQEKLEKMRGFSPLFAGSVGSDACRDMSLWLTRLMGEWGESDRWVSEQSSLFTDVAEPKQM